MSVFKVGHTLQLASHVERGTEKVMCPGTKDFRILFREPNLNLFTVY